ncbi:alpha/beta fold hydrolase [Microbacterium pseudoresistens]
MTRFPMIGAALQELGSAIRYRTSLTQRQRELAILRVAAATDSGFEVHAHRLVSLAVGFTAAEVTAVLNGRYEAADALEGDVLRLTDALLAGGGTAGVALRLGEQAAAEVVTLVGYYRLLAQLMECFEVGVQAAEAELISVRADPDHLIDVDLYGAPTVDAPLIIYLHGGGWTGGSRKDHAERFHALTARGISVASVDYRLATEAPYPAQLDDVRAVLDSLDRQDRPTFLMGASAGSTLAALAAFSGQLHVDGFIGLFGRYDISSAGDALRPAAGLKLPQEIVDALAAGPSLSPKHRVAILAGVDPEHASHDELAAVSPIAHLHAGAPRMLLIHGTGDAVVDHRHSIRLAEHASRLGVACDLRLLPGENHEAPAFATDAVVDEIADFIHRNLHY